MKFLPPHIEGSKSFTHRFVGTLLDTMPKVDMSDTGGGEKVYDPAHWQPMVADLAHRVRRRRIFEIENVPSHGFLQTSVADIAGYKWYECNDVLREAFYLKPIADALIAAGARDVDIYLDIEPPENAWLKPRLSLMRAYFTTLLNWLGLNARIVMYGYARTDNAAITVSHLLNYKDDHGADLEARIHACTGPKYVTIGVDTRPDLRSELFRVCRRALNPATDHVLLYCPDEIPDCTPLIDSLEPDLREFLA